MTYPPPLDDDLGLLANQDEMLTTDTTRAWPLGQPELPDPDTSPADASP